MAKYICNGAQCKCTLGTKEGTLDVKSQSKIFIQDKLMATEKEKTFLPNFISCNKTNPPTPCQPIINAPWEKTKSNVLQREYKGLLESSTATCSSGGTISILDSKQAETKNVIFGDYSSEPKEISKVYAKVRTLASYKGEFGFDWIDVDPETMEIQKIQDVPFKDVEYFYKKGNSTDDLGNIIAKSADEPGAIQVIQQNYGLINFCDHVDIPFVLLKPNQEVTLSLEVFFEGDSQDDYISITGDEFYSFKITGEEERKDENDKTTKKKIIANEKLQLTIKCLKESLDKNYYFLHTGTRGPREIGGLSMMENKVLKLKFRVIALVSNEGNPNEKAKALFQKFADAEVTKYLNENSLNQAGYEIEIENQKMFDDLNPANLDDYFYAFDKEDWKNKNLFKENYITEKKHTVISYTDDGKEIKTTEVRTEVKNVLQEGEIDYKVIEFYKDKLKNKPNTSKVYNEGIIILADYESSTDTVAFSRTTPLNHYAVFLYLNGIEVKDNYSHEIGHMLGLPHLFYDSKEKDAYRIARENILGNGLPEKNPDGTKNEECILPIEIQIQRIRNETNLTYTLTGVTAKKSTLIDKIRNSNIYFQSKISQYTRMKTNIVTKYRGQPGSTIVAGTGQNAQTKDVYLSICTKEINKNTSYLEENKNTLQMLNSIITNKIQLHKYKINLKAYDYSLILNETTKYYYSVINQMHLNYLLFKQGTTKNIMDYYNSKLAYFKNQITIMRNDYENY